MNLDNLVFELIDEFKFLYFPEEFSGIFLDYSKNEVFVLIYLYRYKEASMTEISKYIKSPLNTVTGVVNRLVKKGMAERIQSATDRRIVLIRLTDKALELIVAEKELFKKYFEKVFFELTQEEISAAKSIFKKVKNAIKEKDCKEDVKQFHKKIKKITIE